MKKQSEQTGEQIDVRIKIVKLLASGMMQIHIPAELQRLGISPNSTSSIDKKLKELRTEYKCDTTFQLIHKLTKQGVI